MVQFLPLDVTDEDSVGVVLSHLDNAIQYGEHEEPKEPADVSRCLLSSCLPRPLLRCIAREATRSAMHRHEELTASPLASQMDNGDFDTGE